MVGRNSCKLERCQRSTGTASATDRNDCGLECRQRSTGMDLAVGRNGYELKRRQRSTGNSGDRKLGRQETRATGNSSSLEVKFGCKLERSPQGTGLAAHYITCSTFLAGLSGI